MKKRIFALLLAGLLFTLTACRAESPVVGSWELTSKSVGGVVEDLGDMSVVYTFHKNGTFDMTVDGVDAANGTYTFENNLITWSVNELSGHLIYANGVLLTESIVDDQTVLSSYSKVE